MTLSADPIRPTRSLPLRFATAILFLLSAAYLARGYDMLLKANDPVDLRMKWIDEQYVLHGKNPFNVYLRMESLGADIAPHVSESQSAIDPAIGPPLAGGYPPWSYFTGMAIFTMPWPAARVWFGLLNFAGMSLIASWLLREYQAWGSDKTWFLVACMLAVSAICTTLGIGQYGVLVMAALFGALWADQYQHPVLAGLLLGLAMFKPTIAAPFLLAWLIKRKWIPLFVAAAYLAVASAVVWAMTGSNPLVMLRQMELTSREYFRDNFSLWLLLADHGMPMLLASRLVGGACLACGLILLVWFRNQPMLVLYSIAAVVGRLGTYHRTYDNIMLMPLLLCWAILFLERKERLTTLAFVALGIILWMPAKAMDPYKVQALALLLYPATLAALLYQRTRPSIPPFSRDSKGSALPA